MVVKHSLSLTLREERRLRIMENRFLRRIFGPNIDKNRDCRRLHNEKLHSLCHPSNMVRAIKSIKLKWAEHVAIMEEDRSAFIILTVKSTGKRPLGKPRRR